MDLKELARTVAERSGLSREESADLTRAVVEGLFGQVSDGEATRLAAELPAALADSRPAAPQRRRKGAHPVAVDDFIRQVSGRTGLTEDETRTGTGAVLATLREALGEDGYRHLTGQLPAGYLELMRTTS
jgi:uncharacterized protein (DUF2267 family)